MTDLPHPSVLHQLLAYCPNTGVLTWRERPRELFSSDRSYAAWNAKNAGNEAGGDDGRGYRVVSIFKRILRAHRIAWAMHYGEWPSAHIDHINHNPSDNRIFNLRVVDHAGNARNRSLSSANTSGINGVCWDKKYGKWRASITLNHVKVYIGLFEDITAAADARSRANRMNGFHKNHGCKNEKP